MGPQYFKEVQGTAAGSTETPSLATFDSEFAKKFGNQPTQAYITNAYDATVIAGLAMQYAKSNTDSAAIRDAIRKVTDPNGQKVYAGVDQIKQGLDLIKMGQTIRYVGASGPLLFNQYGDVSAAFAIWTVKDGKVVQTSTMTAAEIAKVAAKIASNQ